MSKKALRKRPLPSFRKFLREHALLFLILALAVAVRFWKFGLVPPGLNQDEASTAYDAFSLLHYGIDRNGFPFPVVLVSWGSGMYSLAAFLAIPFLAVFGLSVFAARLPMLVLGLLTIVAFYAVCRRIDPKLGMLGAFVLAISPWHIMLTRWGLDSNVFPAFLLLGTWALLSAIDRKRIPFLAAVLFGACLYAYGTAYLVVPIFLLAAYTFLLRQKKLTLRAAAWSGAAFLLVALPVITFVIINQFHLPSLNLGFFSIPQLPSTPRYSSFPTLFGDHALAGIWENARTLWNILIFQDDGTTYNVLPWYGYAYVWTLPLIILGIVVSMRRAIASHKTTDTVFLIWFLCALLLGLAISVNVNRINCIFLPLLFFLAVGIDALRKWRLPFAAIIVALSLSFLSFAHAYFTDFPQRIEQGFFASFGEAITDVHSYGPICVTGNVNMPYIYVLFYTKLNPHRFLNSVQYESLHSEFRNVLSFDQYTFGLDQCRGKPYGTYILTHEEAETFDPSHYAIRRFKFYAVVRPLPPAEIRYP